MRWRAEWVTEPSRDHDLCLDLYDEEAHRARIQWNDRGQVELMCWGSGFAIPAEWLVQVIQDYIAQTHHRRSKERPE